MAKFKVGDKVKSSEYYKDKFPNEPTYEGTVEDDVPILGDYWVDTSTGVYPFFEKELELMETEQ